MKKRAPQAGTPIMVRLQPDQLAHLDAWIAHQREPQLTRPEAMRQLIQIAMNKNILGDGAKP